jgi:hypothetical protein
MKNPGFLDFLFEEMGRKPGFWNTVQRWLDWTGRLEGFSRRP